jgi:arginine utilization protein RocB
LTTQWFERTRELAVEMTRFFSPTDQAGERDFGQFLREMLCRWVYYQEHPEQVWLERTVNDPLVRDIVMALVKGRGSRTVILTGHYDVVGIENYGDLAGWACNPDELLPRMISRLEEEKREKGLSAADLLALDDLRGGDFLPGRGLLDMKSGLAAGLAVLERFSQVPEDERVGNLLFVGVPDEEIASHGARAAAAGNRARPRPIPGRGDQPGRVQRLRQQARRTGGLPGQRRQAAAGGLPGRTGDARGLAVQWGERGASGS